MTLDLSPEMRAKAEAAARRNLAAGDWVADDPFLDLYDPPDELEEARGELGRYEEFLHPRGRGGEWIKKPHAEPEMPIRPFKWHKGGTGQVYHPISSLDPGERFGDKSGHKYTVVKHNTADLTTTVRAEDGATHDVPHAFADTPDALKLTRVHRLAEPTAPAPPTPKHAPPNVAVGYAETAKMVADGYANKAQRDLDDSLKQLPEFLKNAEEGHELQMGTVNVYVSMWDTGQLRATLNSFMLPYSEQSDIHGVFLDDTDALKTLTDGAQTLTDRFKATTLATARKNLRGSIAADKGVDGKRAYAAVRGANAENEANAKFSALRDRWPEIVDNQMLVAESGYGKPSTGIGSVFVTASRDTDLKLTHINALAMAVDQKYREEYPKDYGPGGKYGPGSGLKPGAQGSTEHDPAAVLRHEWGHGLFEALSTEQRKQFASMVPHTSTGEVDWNAIGDGLTKYAAAIGEEVNRADYEFRYADKLGVPGYLHETFAESVSVATSPYYKPADWPDWVQKVAEWINGVKPE